MMKTYSRIVAVIAALCLLFSGVSLAEGCGIGEAAVCMPEDLTPPQIVKPVVVPADIQAPADAGPKGDAGGIPGFVTRMYRVVLGRDPDALGQATWEYQLESGRLGAADIVSRFFHSQEYTGKHKSNEEIVIDCYNAMLGRDPDPSGLEHWKKYLAIGMTSDKVCAGFLTSAEFTGLAKSYNIRPGTIELNNARDQNYERTAFVYRLYQNCLERTPDIAGLEHWCGKLQSGSEGTMVASGFVFSKELKQRHLDNAAFVGVMYKAILGRDGDQAGKDFWTDKLNYTNTREFVLNKFMFSKEFSEACAKSGINVGQAIATPDDTDEWQINIELLNFFNTERREHNVPDLTTREDLWEDVAMVRAKEINSKQSSYRPNGDWWSSILVDSGFGDLDDMELWENWCDGVDEPISTWFYDSYLYRPIISPLYTSVAAAFWPEDSWEMVLYTHY